MSNLSLILKGLRRSPVKAVMGMLFGSIGLMAQSPFLYLPPVSTPITATASAGTSTAFSLTLSGVPAGLDVTNAVYNAWCIDVNGDLAASRTYTLYNSEAGVGGNANPALPALIVPNGQAAWNEVNWLLNNKSGATASEIQNAIWTLVDPYYGTGPNDSVTTTLVANAKASGASFIPKGGQLIAVILYVDGIMSATANNFQDVLIEVPLGGSIGDFVWTDANHNGIQDTSELTSGGINGVTLNLYAGSSATGTPIQTTTTASHLGVPGYYQFTGLLAGTYTVQVVTTSPALAGLSPTLTGQGTTSTDSNVNPSTTTLATNVSSDETIDFGFYTPVVCTGSISGLTWIDVDANGLLEAGEGDLSGAIVTIAGPNGYTASYTTTANGAYSFNNLCAGTYSITVTPPSGYIASPVPTGTQTLPVNNPIPDTNLVLSTGTSTITGVDFGFHAPCAGAIGTITFLDNNADGIYNSGDTLINGVTLTLHDLSTGGTATTVSTAVTGINGIYSFTGLCPGSYTVTATTPAGDKPAPVVAPNASQQTNVAAGTAYPVTLTTAAPSNYAVDFGFTPPCTGSVSGTLWNDKNANGNLESGEVDLTNVELVLFNDALTQPIATTYTSNASTGLNYSFTGLCVGGYWIGVVPPSGYSYSPVTVSSSNPTGSYGNGAKFSITEENTVVTPVNIGLYNSTAPPSITCPTSTGQVGSWYSWTASPTGGVAPYYYSGSGSLPPGLNWNSSTGTISGTPTSPGSWTGQITVWDSRGDYGYSSCNQSCTISITGATGVISGYTYDDLNGSKTYNNGDSLISGVTITLSSGGKTIATTVSSSGKYSFTSLPAGSYVVSAPGTTNGETADTTSTISISLANGATSSNNNFGYVAECQVTGHAYETNWWGNKPVSGCTVTISGTDCFGNKVNKTCTTASDGSYCHSGLYPGNYTVSAPQQCWYQDPWGNWAPGSTSAPGKSVAPCSGTTVSGCDFQYK